MSVPYLPGLLDQPQPSMMRVAPPPMARPQAAPITQRIRPYRGSLFDRFKQALMPTPAGMQGMLNPDQESAGRGQGLLDMGLSLLDSSGPTTGPAPSMGQAIARGIHAGQEGFAQHAQGSVQGGLLQDEQARKQQTLSQREQIQAKYQLPPNATADQTAAALKGMFAEFVRNGDTEMVGRLAQVIPSLEHQGAQAHPIEKVDLGDTVKLLDGLTQKEIASYKKGVAPKTPAEEGVDTKFKADQKNKIIDDYARDTKDFHQVMAGWDVLQGATKDPTLATPFGITDAYARITNPGAIVRPTTMEMIDQMGSVGQRMRKYWEHNANGGLPADIVRDFKTTLYNIVKLHHDQYNQIRGKAITRAKQAGIADIDTLLEQYNLENPMTPATRPKTGTGNPLLKK